MATKKPKPLPGYLANPDPTQPNWEAFDGYMGGVRESAAMAASKPEDAGVFRRMVGDTGVSLLRGAIAVPEAAVGLADIATGGRVGKFLENEGGAIGFRPKQAKDFAAEGYSQAQQDASRKVQQAEGFIGTGIAALQNPSVIVQSAVESLPAMGAGGVLARGVMRLGAPAFAAAGIGEGVVSGGQTAEQVRQQTADGLLTPTQAVVSAASGAVTGALGIIANATAAKLGIGDIDTLIAAGAKSPTNEATKQTLVRKVLEGAFSEGVLEELPQSVQEQVAQNYALGKPLDEGVDQAAVLGMLTGAAMGGAAAPLGAGPATRAAAIAPPVATPQAPVTGPATPPAGAAPTATPAAPAAPATPAAMAAQGAGPQPAAPAAAVPPTPAAAPPVAPPVAPTEPVAAAPEIPSEIPAAPPAARSPEQLDAAIGQMHEAAAADLQGTKTFTRKAAPPAPVAPATVINEPDAMGLMQRQAQAEEAAAARPSPDDIREALDEKARRDAATRQLYATIQPGDITNSQGKPLTVKSAAIRKAKDIPSAEVVPVEGGFVVRPPAPSPAPAPKMDGRSSLEREPASWVIREKATGAVVMETFDKAKVDALNTAKYEAVPILQHLQEVNRAAKAGAPVNAAAPASQAPASAGVQEAAAPSPDEALKSRGFTPTGPAPDEWVQPVSGLGDVIAKVVSKPGDPIRAEISADYGGKRLDTRTAEGLPAIDEAIQRAKDGINEGRERMARKVRADETGVVAPEAPAALPTPAPRVTSRQADAEAKRLTAETGKPHRAINKESVDAEGYTVSEWVVEPVPEKQGMTLDEAKAYIERANMERPLGGTWDDIERMQGGRITDKPKAAPAPAVGKDVMPAGLRVTFGGKTYPVESVEDAQRKWSAFRDATGEGVSKVGNGVEVTDGAGRLVARVAYNGRAFDPQDKVLAEAPDRLPMPEGVRQDTAEGYIPPRETTEQARARSEKAAQQAEADLAAEKAGASATPAAPVKEAPQAAPPEDRRKAVDEAAGKMAQTAAFYGLPDNNDFAPTLRTAAEKGDHSRVLGKFITRSGGISDTQRKKAQTLADSGKRPVAVAVLQDKGGAPVAGVYLQMPFQSPTSDDFWNRRVLSDLDAVGDVVYPTGAWNSEPSAPAPPPEPTRPNARTRKISTKTKATADAAEAQRAAYFTPGNVVTSYSGHDEVLAYNAPTTPGGSWSVRVHAVTKGQASGQWVRLGKPQDARLHSTQPDARELARGPVARLMHQVGELVSYTEGRADGRPFPNAPDRGVKPATSAPTATKKAQEAATFPATAQGAIDAFNADDAPAAMAIVAKLPLAELQTVGAGIGFRPQINENAKRYRERLAEVAPRLTKTERETNARKRALFDKLMSRAMNYDRAADHMANSLRLGNAVDSPANTTGYEPMTGRDMGGFIPIPEALDKYAADVASLRNEPDYAEVSAMVRDKRPRVFDHKATPTAAEAPTAPTPTPAEPAAAPVPQTAAEWSNEMQRLRQTKPRPLGKLYGAKGPTPEQAEAHAKEERAWNAAYRKASAEQKKALERDNAAFAAKKAEAKAAQPDTVLTIDMGGSSLDVDLGKPAWQATPEEVKAAVAAKGFSSEKRGKYDPMQAWYEAHSEALAAAAKAGKPIPPEMLYERPGLIRSDLNDDQSDLAADAMVATYRETGDYAKAVQAYRDWGKRAPAAPRQGPSLQEKVEKPAAPDAVVASVGDPNAEGERKFYVTMVRGDRVARLAGPFDTKAEAEAMQPRAQDEANKADPRSAFDAFGVSAVTSKDHKPGVLNDKLGIGAPAQPPAPAEAAPAPERPEALIELRKRASVLEALRRCIA